MLPARGSQISTLCVLRVLFYYYKCELEKKNEIIKSLGGVSDIIKGGMKSERLKRGGEGFFFSVLMRLQLSDLEIQVHHKEVCARVCVRALEH